MRATALMRALPRGPQSATQGDQSVVYNPINPLIRPQSKVKPHLSYLECGPVFLTDLEKKQNPESSRQKYKYFHCSFTDSVLGCVPYNFNDLKGSVTRVQQGPGGCDVTRDGVYQRHQTKLRMK